MRRTRWRSRIIAPQGFLDAAAAAGMTITAQSGMESPNLLVGGQGYFMASDEVHHAGRAPMWLVANDSQSIRTRCPPAARLP